MMDRVITPVGIEETLLALRLRNQTLKSGNAEKLKPEDWSVLDLFFPSEPSATSAVENSSEVGQ